MSKLIKRIGTQKIRFRIEITLKEFLINLTSQNSCKISILIIRGKNKMESVSTPYLLNKKADFGSEKITLQATLYFSKKKKVYQEKPMFIRLLLILPTETKVAGIVKLDLAKYANYYENNLIEESVKVLKCPDPTAKLNFNILARVLKSVNPPKETENLDTQKKDLPIAKKKKIDESEKSESSSNEEESEEESKHANDNSISTEKHQRNDSKQTIQKNLNKSTTQDLKNRGKSQEKIKPSSNKLISSTLPNSQLTHLNAKKPPIDQKEEKSSKKNENLSDMEEVSSLNEAHFKNYEHDHEDTSLINGLSEIDVSNENDRKGKNPTEKMKELEKKCEDLQENVKGLELKNTHLLEDKIYFQNKLNEQMELLKNSQSSISEKEEKLLKNILEINELHEKLKQSQKQIETLTVEKTILESTYRESLSLKDEKLQEMIMRISKLEQENSQKSLKKDSKYENVLDYKFLYDNLKLEHEKTQSDSKEKIDELQKNLSEIKKKIASTNIGQFLEKKNEGKIIELNDQISILNQTIEQLRETITQKEGMVQELLTEKQKILEKYEVKLNESTNKMENSKEKDLIIKQMEENLQRKDKEIMNKSNENTNLKSDIERILSEKAKTSEEFNMISKEYEKLKGETQRKEEEIVGKNKELEEEVTRIRNILAESSQKSTVLESSMNETSTKMEKYEKALLRLNQEKTNLKKINEDLREQFEKMQKEFEKIMDEKNNLLKAILGKEQKETENEEIIKNLENNVTVGKMKLAEIINIAFESGATEFIEKIHSFVLELQND